MYQILVGQYRFPHNLPPTFYKPFRGQANKMYLILHFLSLIIGLLLLVPPQFFCIFTTQSFLFIYFHIKLLNS
jgi:hypothetical protein